mgnify:FL=1
MIYYSEETINELFQSEKFLSDCEDYNRENDDLNDLKKFIDSIQLNKKYFRLEMNKKHGKKKFKNQNTDSDSSSIKEITSLLNKLTDKNILTIREKIKTKLLYKDYLREMIIESILEKCVVHCPYIPLYIELIDYLYPNNPDINTMIEKLSDKLYQNINEMKLTATTEYLIMCERNKRLDKLIGHSILITELEKKKIVTGKIHPILENFILVLSSSEDEEKYKCVQCLYNVFKSYYGDYLLPEGYNLKIKILIEKEKSNKIKFKMMDILDRK